MAIPKDRLAELLAYCGLEEPTEQETLNLNTAYDAAVAYLVGAEVAEPDKTDTERLSLWMRAVKALTLDDFDQRGAQVEAGKLADNPAVRRSINQLKLTEPES